MFSGLGWTRMMWGNRRWTPPCVLTWVVTLWLSADSFVFPKSLKRTFSWNPRRLIVTVCFLVPTQDQRPPSSHFALISTNDTQLTHIMRRKQGCNIDIGCLSTTSPNSVGIKNVVRKKVLFRMGIKITKNAQMLIFSLVSTGCKVVVAVVVHVCQ